MPTDLTPVDDDLAAALAVRAEVTELCRTFPVYADEGAAAGA